MTDLKSFLLFVFKNFKKLALEKASFFILLFLIFTVSTSFAGKKKNTPLQTIGVKFTITGDIQGDYDFKGGLGDKLTAGEGLPCIAIANFTEVLRAERRNLQAWLSFTCTISGQAIELKASRFFVDLKSIEQNKTEKIILKYFTHQIKNIEILVSDLKISRSQSK